MGQPHARGHTPATDTIVLADTAEVANGASDRNRTRDHRFTRAALYLLSYRGTAQQGIRHIVARLGGQRIVDVSWDRAPTIMGPYHTRR